jgi:hypothetical protein
MTRPNTQPNAVRVLYYARSFVDTVRTLSDGMPVRCSLLTVHDDAHVLRAGEPPSGSRTVCLLRDTFVTTPVSTKMRKIIFCHHSIGGTMSTSTEEKYSDHMETIKEVDDDHLGATFEE